MNQVEKTVFDKMEADKFQKIISDNMSFADSLIDQRDIDKYYAKKEAENNADKN